MGDREAVEGQTQASGSPPTAAARARTYLGLDRPNDRGPGGLIRFVVAVTIAVIVGVATTRLLRALVDWGEASNIIGVVVSIWVTGWFINRVWPEPGGDLQPGSGPRARRRRG